LLGFVFGCFGVAFLKRAKQRGDFNLMIAGIAVFVVPYLGLSDLFAWLLCIAFTGWGFRYWK
jgi:hypothetical protein